MRELWFCDREYRGMRMSSWEGVIKVLRDGWVNKRTCSSHVDFCLRGVQTQFYVRFREILDYHLEGGAVTVGVGLILNKIYFPEEVRGQGYFKKMIEDEIKPVLRENGELFAIEAAKADLILPKTTQEGSMWYGAKPLSYEAWKDSKRFMGGDYSPPLGFWMNP